MEEQAKEITGLVEAVSIKTEGKIKYSIKFGGEWYNSFSDMPCKIEKGDSVRITYTVHGQYKNIRGITKIKKDDGIEKPHVSHIDMTGNTGNVGAGNVGEFKPGDEISPFDTEKALIAIDWNWCKGEIERAIQREIKTDGEFAATNCLFIDLRKKRGQIKITNHIKK